MSSLYSGEWNFFLGLDLGSLIDIKYGVIQGGVVGRTPLGACKGDLSTKYIGTESASTPACTLFSNFR